MRATMTELDNQSGTMAQSIARQFENIIASAIDGVISAISRMLAEWIVKSALMAANPRIASTTFVENLAATGALEAGKVVGELGRGLQAGAVLVQKGAATGRLLQNPEDSGPDPEIVGYLGAGAGMREGVDESGDSLEEGFVHGEGGGIRSHEVNSFDRLPVTFHCPQLPS